MNIKEEDDIVQFKNKQSKDKIRQLQTELEQAHTKHSIAKYTNTQHATCLQMALGLKREMSQGQPRQAAEHERQPSYRQEAGQQQQQGKVFFRLV